MVGIQTKNLSKKGNSLTVDVKVMGCMCSNYSDSDSSRKSDHSENNYSIDDSEGESEVFIINNAVGFQVMIRHYDSTYMFFVRFTKEIENDTLSYTVVYTHSGSIFPTDEDSKQFNTAVDTWHYIGDVYYNIDMRVKVDVRVTNPPNLFASLHKDTQMTDFKLQANNGFVHLHKVVAASYSPIFMNLFTGAWKECSEGDVGVITTTEDTLQHLKTYMYLGTLPNTGLKELLILSDHFNLTDLNLRCINALRCEVTSDNVDEYIEFGEKYKLKHFLDDIMAYVDNMRKEK